MYDLSGSPLLKMTQTSLFSGGTEGFDLEVAAGMDPLQAMAICIAAPQTLENNSGGGS